MSLHQMITEIIKTSKTDPKDVFQKLVKLQEETGELGEAVLRRNGFKSPNSKTVEQLDDKVLEEVADVIIIAASILSHFDFKSKDLDDKIESKYKKWKTNLSRCEIWKEVIEDEYDSKS